MNTYKKYAEEYLDNQYKKLSSKLYLIANLCAGQELEELGLKYYFIGCKDKAVICMEKAAEAYSIRHAGVDNEYNSARSEEVRKWLIEISKEDNI